MRAFISLDLENIGVKKEIEKIHYELGRIKAKIKLVETSNLHFTLKFFPHIEFEDININSEQTLTISLGDASSFNSYYSYSDAMECRGARKRISRKRNSRTAQKP